MSEPSLDDIVEELQRLQIRQQYLTDQLAQRLQQAREREGRAPPQGAPRPARAADFVPQEQDDQRLNVGDTVYITNRIRHVPFGRQSTHADRAATIDRIINGRVYVTTFNGFQTWRLDNNLRTLTQEEARDIRREARQNRR